MPLAFESLSHGQVPFGFYNVETDALLLEEYFFFCTDFCAAASALAEAPEAGSELPGYVFSDRAAIGDLMAAIEGTAFRGYLGEIYKLWPFPSNPAEFRQKLAGHGRRGEAEALLKHSAEPTTIPLRAAAEGGFAVGPYLFSGDGFRELLIYVRRGGYPTWEGFEDGQCPDGVRTMAEAWNLGEMK